MYYGPAFFFFILVMEHSGNHPKKDLALRQQVIQKPSKQEKIWQKIKT
jgi:hypothetical protein